MGYETEHPSSSHRPTSLEEIADLVKEQISNAEERIGATGDYAYAWPHTPSGYVNELFPYVSKEKGKEAEEIQKEILEEFNILKSIMIEKRLFPQREKEDNNHSDIPVREMIADDAYVYSVWSRIALPYRIKSGFVYRVWQPVNVGSTAPIIEKRSPIPEFFNDIASLTSQEHIENAVLRKKLEQYKLGVQIGLGVIVVAGIAFLL